MSRSLVVDASVALKWVVTEPGSEEAAALLDVTFVGGAGRWFQCLPAALKWGVTAYDALYVLLARDFDAVLVTADGRLHTAPNGIPVHLLGH